MRIDRPCSENLPSMARTPDGVHCGRCDRDVLDLRRVPRKRALAVLAQKRATEGKVCAWVRATPEGTPIFAPDPSPLARFVAPAIVASALTACGASATEVRPPIAFVTEPASPPPATQATPRAAHVQTPPPPRARIRPASNTPPVEIEMAGDMSF